MAHHYRPSITPMVPSANIPSVNGMVLPSSVTLVPNTFNLPQHHQFISRPAFNAPPFQQMQVPVMNAMTAPMPNMYAAPARVPSPSSQMDPMRFLEDQRKLEKERNFQLQQQRLKQFTVAGKKGNLKADSLIDSMFGKVQHKKNIPSTNTSLQFNGSLKEKKLHMPSPEHLFTTNSSQCNKDPHTDISATNAQKNDKKGLDVMMAECSNLTGPQKANKFSKPVVKEIAPSTQKHSQFVASNKACDWKNVQGLDEVFVQKRLRFPAWCNSENVPEVYKKIEAYTTETGQHLPETKLLFPILLSSCLPHPVLGQIWEMVNQSAPGNLTIEEMYAALALIAVAQTGHPVRSIDVLHQLPSCPTPHLQCFASPPTNEESPTDKPSPPSIEEKSHQVVRPTSIALCNDADFEKSSNLNNLSASGFISSPDDDFDDFKSATPTAVNFILQTPTIEPDPKDDEFDDFKQAPILNSYPFRNKKSVFEPSKVEQDLMSPEEDKYSVFRVLQEVKGKDDVNNMDTGNKNLFKAPMKESLILDSGEKQISEASLGSNAIMNDLFDSSNIDDDFGDFIHISPSPFVTKDQVESLVENFADFANFSDSTFETISSGNAKEEFPDFSSSAPIVSKSQLGGLFEAQNNNFLIPESHGSGVDDEFGDFASCKTFPVINHMLDNSQEPSALHPTFNQAEEEFASFTSNVSQSKLEGSQEFGFFCNSKDSISLAESQSISSLELGTFDGGGCSGESKSSLSRQGSIPSLDLKSTVLEGVEGNEDSFGEFQNVAFVAPSAEVSSQSKDSKTTERSKISTVPLQVYQTAKNTSLVDKYSVIRSKMKEDEDKHISSWVRCLQSSVDILRNTKHIFNQMSCSSVSKEVLCSEEGENYIKDVIEVYKVTCRIAIASKSANKQNSQILDLLAEADECWHTICGFFAGTSMMPEEKSLNFTNAIIRAGMDDNMKACGVCLLNVDAKCSSGCTEGVLKLSYGGRNYHNTCANLWVNCVEPLLPSLCLPQLL